MSGREASAIGSPDTACRGAQFGRGFRVVGSAIIVLAGVVLRFAYLDADPNYYAWGGYITDEGRWLKYARDLVLYGNIRDLDWAIHIHLAPAFHLLHLVVFKTLGVSFFSARLATAAAGALLVVVAWRLLSRVATTEGLLVGLMLLALEVDLIMLSRVAIPEMGTMCLQLVAYAVIVGAPPTVPRMVTAGLLLLLALAVKATAAPIVLIFSVLVLVVGWETTEGRPLRHLATFWVGLGALPLVAVLVWIVRGGTLAGGALADSYRLLRSLLGVADLYSVFGIFLESDLAPLLNSWTLGATLIASAYLLRDGETGSVELRRYYVTSLTWSVLQLMVGATFSYYPDRYKIYVLVPLAINVATGLSLLLSSPAGDSVSDSRQVSGSRRWAALLALALPAAGLLASLVATGAALAGIETWRFRVRLVLLAGTLLVLVAVLAWVVRAGRQGAILFFAALPLTVGLGWFLSQRLDINARPLWPPETGPATWWSGGGWTAIAVAALLVVWLRRVGPAGRGSLAVLAVFVYLALSVSRIATTYVEPRYTIKETSRQLGTLLSGTSGVIATARGDGLFLDTALYFRALPDDWEVWQPAAVVIAADAQATTARIDRDYELVAVRRLYVSRELLAARLPQAPTIELIRVCRRRAGQDARRDAAAPPSCFAPLAPETDR